MIIEKRHCTSCKTENNLMRYNKRTNANGDLIIYFLCRTCNAEKKRKWYYAGNQKKSLAYNAKWAANKKSIVL